MFVTVACFVSHAHQELLPFEKIEQFRAMPCGLRLATGLGEIWHVRAAVPFSMPPFPAADALMVTGPPIEMQVAAPVLASMLTVLVSEEVHCARRLLSVTGA